MFHNGIVKIYDLSWEKHPSIFFIDLKKKCNFETTYLAPEFLSIEGINEEKSDIWLLGVSIFEMLFGYCPIQNILELTRINTPIEIPKTNNPFLSTLLSKMLIKDSNRRIGWEELLSLKISSEG